MNYVIGKATEDIEAGDACVWDAAKGTISKSKELSFKPTFEEKLDKMFDQYNKKVDDDFYWIKKLIKIDASDLRLSKQWLDWAFIPVTAVLDKHTRLFPHQRQAMRDMVIGNTFLYIK